MATEITMPRLSDSMEEGTILKWLVAEGDHVQPGQELVEVETDKATVTHEADEAGVILALTAPEGASVAVGAAIAVLGAPGEALSAPPAAATAAAGRAAGAGADAGAGEAGDEGAVAAPPAAVTSPAVASAAVTSPAAGPGSPGTANGARATNGRVKASPLARRIAARAGLGLDGLTGSGPHGRVIRADVQRALAQTRAPAAGDDAPARTGSHVEPLSRLQRTVAQRMSRSRAEVPDIELRLAVDMTATVALRAQLRALEESPPSINDFIVKAAAVALREFPRVNGAYREDGFELFAHVNVGIAVAADDALLVPTVFDADRLPLGEIARTTRALARSVRERSIAPAQLDGATFTISNLGMYGIDSFSAVINQPQAAILAVGALARRPVVADDGTIVARETLELALACDHRILYGADGARFLARVRELLEHPLAMLVG